MSHRKPLLWKGRAIVRGEWYDSLVTTRPIELSHEHPAGATFVPRPHPRTSGGQMLPWTVLHVTEVCPKDEDGWTNLRIWGGANQYTVDELRRLDRLDRSAEDLATLERLGELGAKPALAVTTIGVPAAGVRAGDVLMRAVYPHHRPERIRGYQHALSLGDHEVVREAIRDAGDGALREITPRFVRGRDTVRAFIEDGRLWGRRLKKWYPRLFVLRPFTHAVSAPIHAVSDEAAIFDLLTDVGCRMPIGGAS